MTPCICVTCGCFSNEYNLYAVRRCSYKKLPVDVKPGSQILCADGSIVLEVLSCDPGAGTVRCKCTNNASLG